MATGERISARPETEELLYRCTFGAPEFGLLEWRGQFLNDIFRVASGAGIARVEDFIIDRKPDALSQQSVNVRLLQGKGNLRMSVDRYEVSARNYTEDELAKLIETVEGIHPVIAKHVAGFLPSKSQVVLAFHITLDGTSAEDYFCSELKGQGSLTGAKIFGFEYNFSIPEADGAMLVEKSFAYSNAVFVRFNLDWKGEVSDFKGAQRKVLQLVGERLRELNLNVARL